MVSVSALDTAAVPAETLSACCAADWLVCVLRTITVAAFESACEAEVLTLWLSEEVDSDVLSLSEVDILSLVETDALPEIDTLSDTDVLPLTDSDADARSLVDIETLALVDAALFDKLSLSDVDFDALSFAEVEADLLSDSLVALRVLVL